MASSSRREKMAEGRIGANGRLARPNGVPVCPYLLANRERVPRGDLYRK